MPDLGGNRPQAKQFDDEQKRMKKQGNISLFITDEIITNTLHHI